MNHVSDLLPFYVNQTLDLAERQRVAAHLQTCATCREELAFWTLTADVVAEACHEAEPVTAQPAVRRSHSLRRAWSLVSAQALLVRWQVGLASAVVLLFGLIALLTSRGSASLALGAVHWVAPLATAVAVALVYAPEEQGVGELLYVMPTSPRLVLLARLALIYSANGLLIALLTLLLGARGALFSLLLGHWLAPMALLSSLALMLAILVNASVGAVTAAMIWLGLGFAPVFSERLGEWVLLFARTLMQPALLWPLVTVHLGIALWQVGAARPRQASTIE